MNMNAKSKTDINVFASLQVLQMIYDIFFIVYTVVTSIVFTVGNILTSESVSYF